MIPRQQLEQNRLPFGSEDTMAEELERGDRVAWNTSQGTTTGRVVRKLTRPTKIKGHEVKASKEHPEYLVESDSSGARAAHKPDALEQR
jgi:hypothetical protein